MATYSGLRISINDSFPTNNQEFITAQILRTFLNDQIDQLGQLQLRGVAVPSGVPGVINGPSSWFASTAGTYSNFGGEVVGANELKYIINNGDNGWSSQTILDLGSIGFVGSVADTNSISLDVLSGELTANVNISTAAGNDISVTQTGVFLDVNQVQFTDTHGIIGQGNNYSLDAMIDALALLSVADDYVASVANSTSVNLSVASGQLTASVNAIGTGTVIDTNDLTGAGAGATVSLQSVVDVVGTGGSSLWSTNGTNVWRSSGTVAIGTTASSAKFHLKGDATTVATTSMRIENSASEDLFYIRDDGSVWLNKYGTARASDGVPNSILWSTFSYGAVRRSSIADLASALNSDGSLNSPWTVTSGDVFRTSGRVGINTTSATLGTLVLKQESDTHFGGFSFLNAAGGSFANMFVNGNKFEIGMNAGGTGVTTINTGGGNVGIGTTSPLATLHVQGNQIITSDTVAPFIAVGRGGNEAQAGEFRFLESSTGSWTGGYGFRFRLDGSQNEFLFESNNGGTEVEIFRVDRGSGGMKFPAVANGTPSTFAAFDNVNNLIKRTSSELISDLGLSNNSYSNGLTEVSGTVKLGGTLTELTTTITTGSANTLLINHGNATTSQQSAFNAVGHTRLLSTTASGQNANYYHTTQSHILNAELPGTNKSTLAVVNGSVQLTSDNLTNNNLGIFNVFSSSIQLQMQDGTNTSSIITTPTTITISAVNVTAVPNQMVVGASAVEGSAALDVKSTTKAFYPPRMTTSQRDAISGIVNGAIIYNSTTNKFQGHANSAWVDFHL